MLQFIAILIFYVLLTFIAPGTDFVSFADEIPIGFAEKSIGLIVRDDELYIDFRLGLNDKDIRRFCTEWDIEAASENPSNLATFSSELGTRLPAALNVTIDGKALEAEIVEARPGGQHHVSCYVQLKYKLPKNTSTSAITQNLKFVDNSFAEMDGAIRLACKAQGETMLRESNVASLIVRAERYVLTELTDEERQKRLSISSKLLVPALKPASQNSAPKLNSETDKN